MSKQLIRDGIEDDLFPSNSQTESPKKKAARKQLQAIAAGKPIKKGPIQILFSNILADEEGSLGDYVVNDILIPVVKSTLSDIVTGSIEILLYGDRQGGRSSLRRDRGRSYTSYSSLYQRPDDRDRRYGRRPSRGTRVEDVIFESRADAEEVLIQLADLLGEYGLVSMAEFYELSGMPVTYADRNHGWTDLRNAYVERYRDGYLIKFPRSRPLD